MSTILGKDIKVGSAFMTKTKSGEQVFVYIFLEKTGQEGKVTQWKYAIVPGTKKAFVVQGEFYNYFSYFNTHSYHWL